MAKTKDLVDEFLQAGVDAERARRLAQDRRRKRTIAGLAIGLAVISVLAGVAIWFAIQNQQRADDLEIAQAETARERDLSNTMGIVRLAEADAFQDPARGVRFALTALALSPDPTLSEPINALRRNLAARPSRYLLRPIEWDWQSINAVAFSPDTRTLVAGSPAGLALWEVIDGADGPELRTPQAQILVGWGAITSLAFYPGTGSGLLAAGTGSGVQLGYLASPPGILPGAEESIWSLAWSPNGAFLASGMADGIVQVWEVPAASSPWPEPRRLSVESDSRPYVGALGFSPDSQYLAAAGGSGITVWKTADPDKPHLVLRCKDLGWVDWLDFVTERGSEPGIAPSTRLYASSGGAIFTWELTQSECDTSPILLLVEGTATNVQAAGVSPNERKISFNASDNVVRILDDDTDAIISLRGHAFRINSVAFSAHHDLVATGSEDTTVRLWDLQLERMEPRILKDQDAATLAYDRQGQLWAAGTRPESLDVWQPGSPNSTTRRLLKTADGEPEGIALLGRDVHWASFLDYDGWLSVWDLGAATEQPAVEFDLGAFPTWSLSSDGRVLAMVAEMGDIRVWRLSDPPEEITTLPCPDNYCYVVALAWSPDGANLAYHYGYGPLHIWNLEQQVLRDLEPGRGMDDYATSLLFSADGLSLAAGSAQDEIHLWHLDKPSAPPTVLVGPRDLGSGTESLAFSPDGAFLAAGSSQGTIRLWDLDHPDRQPQLFEGHSDTITSLAFDQAGQLASSSLDGTVRIWRTRPQDLIDFANQRIYRPPLYAGEFEDFLAPFIPEIGGER
jgi:WD40 repeat protein